MPVSSVVVQEHLVHAFESFSQVVLKGREGSADSWGPKAMSDEAEVSQAALNARFQNRGGPAVSNGRPVLGQEICKFFTKLPAWKRERQREEERERKAVVRLIPHFSEITKVEERGRFRPKLTPRPRIGPFGHLPRPLQCVETGHGKPATSCSRGCSSGEGFLQLQDNTRSGDRNLSDSHQHASKTLWKPIPAWCL